MPKSANPFPSLAHRLFSLICWPALAAFTPVWSEDIADRAGTAEFQYLETLIHARPAGVAGAYVSLAEGADAIGYNPAGLARHAEGRSFSGTFRHHFVGVSSGSATYSYPGAKGFRYAFSAAYINYGRIAVVDENNASLGKDIIPSSMNPSFSLAKKVTEKTTLGFTAKLMQEYLGDFEESQMAMGWGTDFGLLYQPSVRNIGFGLGLLNLGRKERSHTLDGDKGGLLPATLKGGMFYYLKGGSGTRAVADVELPWSDLPLLSGGLEYAYSPYFILRGGSRINVSEARYYFDKITDQENGDFTGGSALKLTGGFSLLADTFGLDYAVQYWQNLSWVHAVTFKYPIGI